VTNEEVRNVESVRERAHRASTQDEPGRLTAAPLLEFTGIAPTTVRVVPIEQQPAEKLHAYTREYDGLPLSVQAKPVGLSADLAYVAE
jgi:hypothetical protein